MHKALKILLVEDHVDTQVMMVRLLKTFQHEVKPASSIEEAMGLAESHKFDLVISDLGLPDGTGLALMEQLKVKYGLRGIAVSGERAEDCGAETIAAGFVAHVTKPINFEHLRKVIAAAAL